MAGQSVQCSVSGLSGKKFARATLASAVIDAQVHIILVQPGECRVLVRIEARQ